MCRIYVVATTLSLFLMFPILVQAGQRNQLNNGQKNQKDNGQQNQNDDSQQGQIVEDQQGPKVGKQFDWLADDYTYDPLGQQPTKKRHKNKAAKLRNNRLQQNAADNGEQNRKANQPKPANRSYQESGEHNQKDDGQKNQLDNGQQ